jgi:steroid delta-isomerase-like uncharacterized protein
MPAEENKRLVRRYMDEVQNQGKLDVLDEIIDPSSQGHLPGAPEPIRGPEGEKGLAQMFSSAFSNSRLEVESLIGEGDTVGVRLRYHGTHNGEFQGVPATGKTIDLPGMAMFRIANGKIVESWYQPDLMTLLQQLGVMPSADQATD